MEFIAGLVVGLIVASLYWAPHYYASMDRTDQAIALAEQALHEARRA